MKTATGTFGGQTGGFVVFVACVAIVGHWLLLGHFGGAHWDAASGNLFTWIVGGTLTLVLFWYLSRWSARIWDREKPTS